MSALTSVVLPVYNQADHIAGVVEGHLPILDRLELPYELIMVTNNCRDASPEICARLAAEHEPVRHVDIEDGGWGRAVRAGLREARGDTLAYSNSARTTPEILALTLSYARAYPEVVVKANRRIREGLARRVGSVLYNFECRALFDLAFWDVNGTPKVFPRSFTGLLELQHDDDLIDAEFAAICRRREYPVVEIPILATTRYGGDSTTSIRSAVRMYVGAVRLQRELDARP